MHDLLTVAFEAHHPELNYHRRYQIRVGRDLLRDWTVSIQYGRTGQRGQEQQHFIARTAEEGRRMVRERLQRRLSAPQRIGCPYRLTEFRAADGFDAAWWLPGEVMGKFFVASTRM